MYTRGTDLRDNGVYTGLGSTLRYPSVTSIVDKLCDDMAFVHAAYIAKDVVELAQAHAEGRMVERWVPAVDTSGTGGTGEGADWGAADRFIRSKVPAWDALTDIQYIKTAGWRRLRQAADGGTVVHDLADELSVGSGLVAADVGEWCEAKIYERGYTCSVDDAIPYAASLLRWWDEVQPICHHISAPVFHNGRKGECEDGWGLCAGTIDFIGMVDGVSYILDFKRSRASRRAHAMQLAAYRHSQRIYTRNGPRRMPRVHGVMSVLVGADRVTPRIWTTTDDWFRAFRHGAAAIARLRGEMNVQTLSHLVVKVVK